MSERVLVAGAPALVIAVVSWSSGGYFPRSWGAVLLIEAIALASVAILATRIDADPRALVVVAALAGLAVWELASRAWAIAPDAAVVETERTLLYAGAAAAAFLVVTRERAAELVLGVLGGAGAATLGGLAEHVLGSGDPRERLETPVGYANAAGILAATTMLLALGLGRGGPGWRRGLAAALAPPAAVALYLSLSRGSVLAAALGIAVLAVTTRSAAELARLAVTAAPAGVAVVLAAWGTPFDEPGATGAEVAGLLVLAGLGAVAAILAVRSPWTAPARLSSRTVTLVGGAAIVLAVIGLTAVGVREVRESRSAPASQQGAPDRLLSVSTSFRADYWDVAARMAADAPLVGEGAGGFERIWLRERPALLFVRDAHNLYLETLAELGAVGLALLLVALLVPLVGARQASRDPAGGAALAGYTALLAHALLDWDWELPAVMLCTVLLGVALVRLGGAGELRPLGVGARAAILASAAALGVVAVVAHAGNGSLAEARDALDRGDATTARREADRARRFQPWSAEPWLLLGEAELAAGRREAGLRALRRATAEDPGSWAGWLQLALVSDGNERRQALARVRELNPLAPELDVAGSITDHP